MTTINLTSTNMNIDWGGRYTLSYFNSDPAG